MLLIIEVHWFLLSSPKKRFRKYLKPILEMYSVEYHVKTLH